MAVFDQNRATLDPEMSLWQALTSDKDMAVSGRSDQIMVRGSPRHVVGYLKDFLFSDAQVRSPVRSLSGGEKSRLILARIMARESNLLVLDEPTNDLDVETLDLLQELLADYPGTVLLVSHDRDFLDRVATTTVAAEGRGRWGIYAGGWSDYQSQRGEKAIGSGDKSLKKSRKAERSVAKATAGLSFTEQHRYDALPDEIARLETEIDRLTTFLSEPDLFTREPKKFAKASEALAERQTVLSAAETEWLSLAERAEADG